MKKITKYKYTCICNNSTLTFFLLIFTIIKMQCLTSLCNSLTFGLFLSHSPIYFYILTKILTLYKFHKSLINVLISQSTSLLKKYSLTIGKFACIYLIYLLFIFLINFISNQKDNNIRICLLTYWFYPSFYTMKCFLFCYIVYY